MDMDASIYFICLTIRKHTFMQRELKVGSEERKDNVLFLTGMKKIKFFKFST